MREEQHWKNTCSSAELEHARASQQLWFEERADVSLA